MDRYFFSPHLMMSHPEEHHTTNRGALSQHMVNKPETRLNFIVMRPAPQFSGMLARNESFSVLTFMAVFLFTSPVSTPKLIHLADFVVTFHTSWQLSFFYKYRIFPTFQKPVVELPNAGSSHPHHELNGQGILHLPRNLKQRRRHFALQRIYHLVLVIRYVVM